MWTCQSVVGEADVPESLLANDEDSSYKPSIMEADNGSVSSPKGVVCDGSQSLVGGTGELVSASES